MLLCYLLPADIGVAALETTLQGKAGKSEGDT